MLRWQSVSPKIFSMLSYGTALLLFASAVANGAVISSVATYSNPLTSSVSPTGIVYPTPSPSPSPILTPTPTSSGSFSFSPIQPSGTYTGPICYLLPSPRPDPFIAPPASSPIAGKYLTYYSGIAGLGDPFSTAWLYGVDAPVGPWYPRPCGYIYLNILESGYSWKHLTYDGTTNTNWNATVGTNLTSTTWNGQKYVSDSFVACYTIKDAISQIANSIKWYLFLQTGKDVPTENAFGDAILQSSCVSTKILVKENSISPITTV